MNLVLTYFHGVIGPKIMLSVPEDVPDDIKGTIKGFFDVELDNPFFEVVLMEDKLKITNLYFEIPSDWARGNKEMVMISVITSKNSDTEFFYDLLKEVSDKIRGSINIYKSLYKFDDIRKKDQEVDQKYEELEKIVSVCLDDMQDKKRETKIRELLATRGLTLAGAYKVFGIIITDVISCLLQQKKIVLCGDTDASAALLNVFNRIFLDILEIDDKLYIRDKCESPDPETLIINTSLKLIESGQACEEAHAAITRYLQEAEKTGDNDAAIISLRQRLSILLKAGELLEKILTDKKSEKAVIRLIKQHLRVRIKNDELFAIRLILEARGKHDAANNIVVSKLSRF